MSGWKAGVRMTASESKVLVTSDTGDDLLKAALPSWSNHPRALLTLLEGIALWQGAPLCVAISAAGDAEASHVLDLCGDRIWPQESALVRFFFVAPTRRKRHRLRGVGDFRQLRLVVDDRGLR